EYRTRHVEDLYNSLLHRRSDSEGLAYFVSLLAAGGSDEQVQAMMAGSPEYYQQRGGSSADGFLDALYGDGLGRPGGNGGRAFFKAALSRGATTGQVAALVFGSLEYQQHLVAGYYLRFLRRDADAAGLAYFVNALRTRRLGHDEDVIAALVGSQEYFDRL